MLKNKLQKLKPRIHPLPPGVSGRDLNVMIATWFGVGRLRPAPGTLGTLAAMPFGYSIHYFTGMLGLALAALLLTFVGAVAAGAYGRKSGEKDDQSIVVDEVVGIWIAVIPAGNEPGLWMLAFVLFRIFDIYKPWPASYFDKKKRGGMDVMLDDVVAGIFAMLGVASGAVSFLMQQ